MAANCNLDKPSVLIGLVIFLFILVVWCLIVISLINLIWKTIDKPGNKTTADCVWIVLEFFLLFVLFGGLSVF